MHSFLFETLVKGSDIISGDLGLEVIFNVVVLVVVDHFL